MNKLNRGFSRLKLLLFEHKHLTKSTKMASSSCVVDEEKCVAVSEEKDESANPHVNVELPGKRNRFLDDTKNVFEHNAWDNVEWDEKQETEAFQITTEQMKHKASDKNKVDYEDNAGDYWDKFYGIHQNRFFKDRSWLFTEFPELMPDTSCFAKDTKNSTDKGRNSEFLSESDPVLDVSNNVDKLNLESKITVVDQSTENFPGSKAKFRIFEVGCGVGNTVFPLLRTNDNPDLMMYCCDFSETAIQIVKGHPDYETQRCHAFVADIREDHQLPFPENSIDVILLVFVLSAIQPEKMQYVINKLTRHLKPGGILLFRDYGRYDLAQLRFKKVLINTINAMLALRKHDCNATITDAGRCLDTNFYARSDGTLVYFFTQDELDSLFSKAGLEKRLNYIDRRLVVNRGRQIKMYRVWILCKYTKPGNESCVKVHINTNFENEKAVDE